MRRSHKSWEGTALLFFILLTVLLGVGFNLGYTYKFPVPLLGIVVVSAAVALGFRYWPRRPAGPGPDQRDV